MRWPLPSPLASFNCPYHLHIFSFHSFLWKALFASTRRCTTRVDSFLSKAAHPFYFYFAWWVMRNVIFCTVVHNSKVAHAFENQLLSFDNSKCWLCSGQLWSIVQLSCDLPLINECSYICCTRWPRHKTATQMEKDWAGAVAVVQPAPRQQC